MLDAKDHKHKQINGIVKRKRYEHDDITENKQERGGRMKNDRAF